MCECMFVFEGVCVLFFTSVAFENVPFRPEGEGAYAVFFFRAFGFIRAFIGLTVLILALLCRVCAFFCRFCLMYSKRFLFLSYEFIVSSCLD